MDHQVSYSEARSNFATYLNRVAENGEIINITRRGKKDVALISRDDLESLLETLHLLSNPANARRLLEAHERAKNLQRLVSLEHTDLATMIRDLDA